MATTAIRLPVVVTTMVAPAYAQAGAAAFLLGFLATLIGGAGDPTSLPAPGGAFIIGFFTGLGISIGAKMRRWGWLPWSSGLCGLVGWIFYATLFVVMKFVWP